MDVHVFRFGWIEVYLFNEMLDTVVCAMETIAVILVREV
jgi:hypothetical protein